MPEGTLTKQLTSLLETAETLNNTSNSINTILNTIEQALVKANIGLEVWLPFSAGVLHASKAEQISYEDRRISFQRAVELGFAKLADGWHLATRELLVEDGRLSTLEQGPSSLAQAARQERITALRLLPALLDKIREAAEEAITEIEAAKQLALD